MPLLLFVLVVVVPATEIWLFVQVSQEIGFGLALLLLVIAAVIGLYVLRWAGARGRAALRRAQAGETPSPRESADVGLLWLAGLLLFLPGFLGDVVGLLLLLPPVRALVRTVLGRQLAARVTVARARFGPMRGGRVGPTDVVQGEVVREDQTGDQHGPPVPPRELPPT